MTGGTSLFSRVRLRGSPHRFVVGLLALLAAAPVRATPAELVGAGAEGVALAGSGTSLDMGPHAALVNPAGLGSQEDKELAFGFRATRFSLSIERDGTTTRFPADLSNGLMLGVAAPLSRGRFKTGIGLMAETPPNFVVRAEVPFDGTPTFPLVSGRAQSLDFGAGLGFRLGGLSVGAGVRALAALSGRVAVVQDPAGPSGAVGTRLLPAWAPTAGLRLDFSSRWRFAASIRGVLRADFDAEVASARLGPISVVPLNIEGVAAYEPLKIDAEVSERRGGFEVLAGVRYERWSAFDGWVGPTVVCPPARGSCGTAPPARPDYRDIVSPRVAGSYEFRLEPVTLAVRAGYTFVPSPIPEQKSVKNELDAWRHGFALGYSVALPKDLLPIRLDAAYRLDLLAPRTHEKPGGSRLTTRGTLQTIVFGAGVNL